MTNHRPYVAFVIATALLLLIGWQIPTKRDSMTLLAILFVIADASLEQLEELIHRYKK